MSKKKRKYVKKSSYWNNLSKGKAATASTEINIEPALCGENYYVSGSEIKASCSVSDALRSGNSSSTGRRINRAAVSGTSAKYKNIAEGMLPYTITADGVDSREAIELCQKAYANVPIFRNAIDVMSEFSNSEIYLEGGSENTNKFIYKWFEKINLWKLKDQYFREYYRSGNIFLYRIDGTFNKDDFNKLNKIYGSEYLNPGKIPVRYILLNPYDIISTRSTSFADGVYKKILSEYELERLRNPKNEEDKQILESLPPEVRENIKKGGFAMDGLNVDLDPDRLLYSFYKKQDYEPFAVPFGFPVLDDINWKIELKKIDQAISRTIENVVLLITMGAEPDKGGINPQNLNAMQCLFQNESVGRVLVSDYTTKADFIIPDINKILGPQKYEIVNQDIREGLQNIIVGKENYSSTQIKAQIFLERLKEARNAFLNDFLMPQVKLVCKALGFRKYPTVKFQEVDIKDEIQFQRVITRLLEIGVISPEQGMDSIRTGIFPHSSTLKVAQEGYVEDREKGMYNPLIGGVPLIEPPGSDVPNEAPTKTPAKQNGRPTGATANENYSRKDLQSIIAKIEKARKDGSEILKKEYKVKRLNENQNNILDKLIESVIISSEQNDWVDKIKACVKDPEIIDQLKVIESISEISSNHQLPEYPAAILYHSKKNN